MTDHLIIADGPVAYPFDLPLIDSPTHRAIALYRSYAEQADMEVRRGLGQFFTPLPVARFMAALVTLTQEMRLLEPGAGTAVLSAAVCEAIAGKIKRLHIDAFEVDPVLVDACADTLEVASEWLRERGTTCTFEVHHADFIASDNGDRYDVAISNPPYFKLNKDDGRARALADAVHGQPNIYALFMAAMAARLREGGQMITITPRSFASGAYFRRLREVLFSAVTPEALHLFESRRDAFRADDVLQENVIMRARRGNVDAEAQVAISASRGTSELADVSRRDVPLERVVDRSHRQVVLHIPTTSVDDEVLALVRKWPACLADLGLRVSTGPVVAFRATEFIQDEPNGRQTVPLLWLQHVKQMRVQWPLKGHKPEYIVDSAASSKLLVRNQTYVVMRRFSAKEERRRLVAAPLLAGTLPGRNIGLENHLNYIHRPTGVVGEHEAVGLAALLSSAVADRYFRISNGNTQVSAVELRHLPLPPLEQLVAIGEEAMLHGEADQAVAAVLRVPAKLQKQLDRNAESR